MCVCVCVRACSEHVCVRACARAYVRVFEGHVRVWCACMVCTSTRVYGSIFPPLISLYSPSLPPFISVTHSCKHFLSGARFLHALSLVRALTHTHALSCARARSCSRTFNSLPSTPDDLAIEGGEPLKEEVRWRGGLGGRATEPD
jgi:hypothetical protein